ncbi:MAG: hypothetical protein AABX38_02895 [Candidatus Micrarchaeota archaeon]
MSSIDLISETLKETFSFVKSNWKTLFVNSFKISVVSIIALIAGFLIYFGAIFLAASISTWIIWLALPFLILGYLISGVSFSAFFNSIDATYNCKKLELIKTIKANFVPYTKFIVVLSAAMFVMFLPLIAWFMYSASNQLSSSAAYGYGSSNPAALTNAFSNIFIFLGLYIIELILIFIFSFFTQFAVWDVVLNKKGPVESIKSSIAMVKSNFWAVLGLDFLVYILLMAVVTILYFLFIPAFLVGAVSGGILSIPIILVFYLVYFMVLLLFYIFLFSALYILWKKLSTKVVVKSAK